MSVTSKFRSQIFANFLSLSAVQGVNFLLPLLTVPYLFTVLGVENYGLFNFGYALNQYFMIFTDFGFSLSATKSISANRDDYQRVNFILNSTLAAGFLLVLLSSLLLFILIFTVDKFAYEKFFYLSFFGIVIGNSLFPVWFFQGIERMKFVTYVNVILKITSIIPIFFLVKTSTDYQLLPVLYSFGYIVGGLVSLYIVYFKMGMNFFVPDWHSIWSVIKESFMYFLSRGAASLYGASNILLIGSTLGNVAVGYYDVADKIFKALNSVYNPVSGAIYPYMVKNKDVAFFRSLFYKLVVLNVVAVSLLYIGAPYIISEIFKTTNIESIAVLKVLSLVCLITAPSILLGFPLLVPFGHPNYVNGSIIFASLVHIIGLCFLYLTKNISLVNIAWMVAITEFCIFIVRAYATRKFGLMK
jgi:PST family polysaccharide transporter